MIPFAPFGALPPAARGIEVTSDGGHIGRRPTNRFHGQSAQQADCARLRFPADGIGIMVIFDQSRSRHRCAERPNGAA